MNNNWMTRLAGALLLFPFLSAAADQERDKEGWPSPVHDDIAVGSVLFDRLEYAWGDDEDAINWDVQGWYGGDYNRLWVKTEGEDVRSGGDGGEAELELLYSRMISPFWDLQAGLGQQRIYGPGPDHDRAYATVGLQGLAPYYFEMDPSLRVSEEGDVSASLEAEYELLFTQRLILQPRFATAYAVDEVEEFSVGKGFNFVQAGLRLRYEFAREFAPYIGVSWRKSLGDTADFIEAEGEDVEHTSMVAGIRMWF